LRIIANLHSMSAQKRAHCILIANDFGTILTLHHGTFAPALVDIKG